MPIPQTLNTLKSYFTTGSKPSQAQFFEWLDTMYALYQQGIDAATAANTAAASAVTSAGTSPKVLLNASISSSVWTKGANLNVGTVGVPAVGLVRVTFSSALTNNQYIVVGGMYLPAAAGLSFAGYRGPLIVSSQSAGQIDFTTPGVTGVTTARSEFNGATLSLAIFHP